MLARDRQVKQLMEQMHGPHHPYEVGAGIAGGLLVVAGAGIRFAARRRP